MDAHQLVAGDELRSDDGRWACVDSLSSGDPAPVYNLRVADYHTYFVGSRYWGFSVWAHNQGNCPGVGGEGEGGAPNAAPDLGSFSNAPLRGGHSIESITVAEGKLGTGGASLGQTTIQPIRSGKMTIQLAPGQSASEQSVSIYHEVLEAAALDAKNPPMMLLDLSESEFDMLAYMAQEQFGTATVENLNKLLQAVGF